MANAERWHRHGRRSPLRRLRARETRQGREADDIAKAILVSPADVAIDHVFPPYTDEKVKALAQWFDY